MTRWLLVLFTQYTIVPVCMNELCYQLAYNQTCRLVWVGGKNLKNRQVCIVSLWSWSIMAPLIIERCGAQGRLLFRTVLVATILFFCFETRSRSCLMNMLGVSATINVACWLDLVPCVCAWMLVSYVPRGHVWHSCFSHMSGQKGTANTSAVCDSVWAKS